MRQSRDLVRRRVNAILALHDVIAQRDLRRSIVDTWSDLWGADTSPELRELPAAAACPNRTAWPSLLDHTRGAIRTSARLAAGVPAEYDQSIDADAAVAATALLCAVSLVPVREPASALEAQPVEAQAVRMVTRAAEARGVPTWLTSIVEEAAGVAPPRRVEAVIAAYSHYGLVDAALTAAGTEPIYIPRAAATLAKRMTCDPPDIGVCGELSGALEATWLALGKRSQLPTIPAQTAFPELTTISDARLREAVGAVLVRCLDCGPYRRFEDVPYDSDRPDWNLLFHIRQVNRAANAMADILASEHRFCVDRDVLTSISLLFDADKLLAPTIGPSILSWIPHAVIGTSIALNEGIGLEIAHGIVAHSIRSTMYPSSVEAVLVAYADYIDVDTAGVIRESYMVLPMMQRR